MKFEKVLNNRRSIRRYQDMPIEKDVLKDVLKAARMAPSWKNSQCPRYYVVTNDEILAEIRENALPPFNAKNCAQAPALIVCCFENGVSGMGSDGKYANECEDGWSYYDLGLASENLCLQAQRKGLGTLIMGIRNEAVLREILSIPASQTIVSVIAIGYPAIEPKRPQRKPLKETVIFFE